MTMNKVLLNMLIFSTALLFKTTELIPPETHIGLFDLT